MLVWMGVGLGMAAFLGGKLHRGAAGAAGEIGYLPVPGAPLQEDVRHPASGGLQSLVGANVVRMLAGVFGFGALTAEEAVRAAVKAASGSASNGAAPMDLVPPWPGPRSFWARWPAGSRSAWPRYPWSWTRAWSCWAAPSASAGGAALADRVAAEVCRIFPASPRVVPTGVTGAPVLRGAMLAAVDQARSDLLDSV